MEKKKKKSKVKIVLEIIVAIIVIGIIVLGFEYYRVLQEHRESVNLLDKNKFAVYHTIIENNNGKKIKIPVVNLDYHGIQELNKEIADTLKKYDVNNLQEQITPEITKNIVQLLVIFDEGDDTKFLVYNVDIENGNLMNNNELLDKLSINKEMYIHKYKKALAKNIYNNYSILGNTNNNPTLDLSDNDILNMPYLIIGDYAAASYTEDERGIIYNKLIMLENMSADMFTYDDLRVDDLMYGFTEKLVIELMGEPDEIIDSTVSTDVYGKSKTYKYGDLYLTFYNHDGKMLLSEASTESSNYTFAKGLKVGYTKEQVLDSFDRETIYENNLRDIISSDSGESYGKYLYGYSLEDATINPVNTNSNIAYGFINYYGYNLEDPTSDYMIIYNYAEPPYMLPYNDPYNINASLIFDMNSDDIVTGIRWHFFPELSK